MPLWLCCNMRTARVLSPRETRKQSIGASRALYEVDFFGVFGAGQNDTAARGIAVAIEIFGHGVNDDVSAEFDRPLEVGAEESVVHDERGVALRGDFSHGRDVGDAHRGVGWRLDIEHAGVR